jgi:aromatic amino acid aminotransferase I
MTTTLLQKWGFDGYVRWLRGIKATYRMRKNWMCDTFEDVFHLEFDENINGLKTNAAVRDIFDGLGRGVTCYAKHIEGSKEAAWDEKRGLKSKRGPALVSFIPPSGE